MHDKFFDQGRNRAQSHDGILIVISNPGQGAYDRAAFGVGLLPFLLAFRVGTNLRLGSQYNFESRKWF